MPLGLVLTHLRYRQVLTGAFDATFNGDGCGRWRWPMELADGDGDGSDEDADADGELNNERRERGV